MYSHDIEIYPQWDTLPRKFCRTTSNMETKEPKQIPIKWFFLHSDLRKTAQATGKTVAAVFQTVLEKTLLCYHA